jgi:pimeloyl-ACP methyl ester carboxylesterase
MPDVLLMQGGFCPVKDAEGRWTAPGIFAGLTALGLACWRPTGPFSPAHGLDEGGHLTAFIEEQGANAIVAVAGSNGYSAAVRAALDHPTLACALVLCWPATAGDPMADTRGRRALAGFGWPREHIDEILLLGETSVASRTTNSEDLSCRWSQSAIGPVQPNAPRAHGRPDSRSRPDRHTRRLLSLDPKPSLPARTSAFVAELEHPGRVSSWRGGSRCT